MKFGRSKNITPKTNRQLWKCQKCDTCKFKTWVTDKEWNFSIEGHKPLTMRCPNIENGQIGIVRGTDACWRWEKES